MRIKKDHLVLALPFFLLGLLLVIQFRVQARTPVLGTTEINNMASLLQTAVRQKKQLAAQVNQLQAEVNGRLKQQATFRALDGQLVQAEMAAGEIALKGPGVKVTMSTPPSPAGPAYQIQDYDVLQVINELRAAGAEALAVNGQRVVATTEVRQAGSIFSINNTPAGPPFVILAIGNPSTLSSALLMRGGIVDSLAMFYIQVQVNKEQSLVIPAYSGTYQFKYAKTTPSGG